MSVTLSTKDMVWTAAVRFPAAILSVAKSIADLACAIETSNLAPTSVVAAPNASATLVILVVIALVSFDNWDAAAAAEFPAASDIPDISATSFAKVGLLERRIKDKIILVFNLLIIIF